MRQLEEKCTTLSQQVTEVNEHLDLLSNNGTICYFFIYKYFIFHCTVDEAIVINAKLERQQKHHGCVVFSYQDELAMTKAELLRLTTILSIDQQANKITNSDSSNIKDLEQQLKMVSSIKSLSLYSYYPYIATRHDCFIRETDRRIAERELIYF